MILMNSTWGRILFLLCVGSLVFINGCTHRVADLTLISTKNVDLDSIQLNVKKGERVKGEHCGYALLGLIPISLPNLQDAIDQALEKGKGNIMIDQVTYSKVFYFVIASSLCFEVEGTVLNAAEIEN